MASPVLGAQLPDAPHIYVEGVHTLDADPDRFTIHASLAEVAQNAPDAARSVERRLSALLGSLKEAGVPSEAIQAFTIEIDPEYRYMDAERVAVGTRVQRQVKVTLGSVATAQRAVQALIGSDVAEIERVRAFSSKQRDLRRQALELALADAHDRAAAMASGLGRELGRVYSISEFTSRRAPFGSHHSDAISFAQLTKGRGEPFEFRPGRLEVRAEVYVVFTLQK